MFSDYRAFGECCKTILVAGDSADLTATSQILSTGTLPSKYSQMHVVTLIDSEIVVTLKNDIGANTSYDLTLIGQCQVAGVSSISVTSGKVGILFLA